MLHAPSAVMTSAESIALEIKTFLGANRLRLASDEGLISFRVIAGVPVADLDGEDYEVRIEVRRT